MIRNLILATAVAAISPLAFAETPAAVEATTTIGPAIGEATPAFTAATSAGDPVTLETLTGDHGAVIVFSRSLDWCPFCKKQAIDLETVASSLSEKGWPLSLVTYDDTATLAGFATDKSLTYKLVSDEGSAMIDAFNLRNGDMKAGSRFDGIPHPAIVYISADGIVRGVQREDGYKDRPPTAGIPQLVDVLNASATQ